MQPFISADDLSDYLEQDVTSSELATIVLDAACETVRGYIGQQVNLEEEDTVLLDGSGTDALLLPEIPVVEVISVAVDAEDPLIVDEDTEDYRVDERAGVLWRTDSGESFSHLVWPLGRRNVEVIYTHGWAVSEADVGEGGSGGSSLPDVPARVPSDMRMVALSLAQRLFSASGSGELLQSEQMGNYSYQLSAAGAESGGGRSLLNGEHAVLDRYRHRRQK